MFKEDEGTGGEVMGDNTPSTSVGNIASYSPMLTKALKRKNVWSVTGDEYKKICKDSEDNIVAKYGKKTPFLITDGKKYTLVSKL